MPDDSLEMVSAFVERAYVRMQAGEVLLYCLEREDVTPMRTLVEELVLDGPQSLNTLREVLSEVSARRAQLLDDLDRVFSELDQNLRPSGLHLADRYTPYSLACLSSLALYAQLELAGVGEPERADCLQRLLNGQELLTSLIRHFRLLDDIELHLQDWIWGLIYQSARQESFNSRDPNAKKPLSL